jgi:hypothetical protein
MKALKNKIWFTYTARIEAYRRLKSQSFWASLLLCLYSLANLVCSIISIPIPILFGKHTGILLVVLSVISFVFSLLIVSYKFDDRALAMKENYLDLQRLYENLKRDTNGNIDKYIDQYISILERNENHNIIDDIINRINKKTSRDISKKEWFYYYTYRFLKFTFIIIILAIPITLILLSILSLYR